MSKLKGTYFVKKGKGEKPWKVVYGYDKYEERIKNRIVERFATEAEAEFHSRTDSTHLSSGDGEWSYWSPNFCISICI